MATATHFITLLFLLLHSCATQPNLVIKTRDGKVKGKMLQVGSHHVRAFLGIPYAKPPVGKLRFRPPERADGWKGVKDATNFGNTCYQVPDTLFPGFKGAEEWNPNTPLSEDCLFLNIWTPCSRRSLTSLAPVMVWIHGGGLTSGTSSLDLYDGRYLAASEGVVVVSMNYRLGALGFLSLPDNNNVRGNAGLMDQNLALKWIAKNIAAFGGDPSQVTLFGESAGSTAVGFHLLSPLSNGLFQRAIMESGDPLASWASLGLNETWRRAKTLAKSLGCDPSLSSSALEACMQKANASAIVQMQFGVFKQPGSGITPFLVVIDGVFLPDTLDALLKSPGLQKREVLLGFNRNEGSYFTEYGLPGFGLSPSLISRELFLSILDFLVTAEDSLVKDAVIYEYTNWAHVNNGAKNRDALVEFLSDTMFFCPVQHFAQRYSQVGGKLFLYYFVHRSSTNPWPKWMGVMHGYEVEFVFGLPLNPSLHYTHWEKRMSKRIMKQWTNFARTGNPSIYGTNWPEFTPEKKKYVILDTKRPKIGMKLKADRCYFWGEYIPKLIAKSVPGAAASS